MMAVFEQGFKKIIHRFFCIPSYKPGTRLFGYGHLLIKFLFNSFHLHQVPLGVFSQKINIRIDIYFA